MQITHFYAYTIGQIFCMAFIANICTSFVANFVFSKKIGLIVVFIVNLLFLVVFTSDTFVFLFTLQRYAAFPSLYVNVRLSLG